MWLGVLCLLVLAPVGQDWPAFRGSGGAGRAAGVSLPRDFDAGVHEAWRASVPPGFSSPVVAAGKVVLSGVDRGRPVVVAHDANSGALLWRRWLSASGIQVSDAVDERAQDASLAPSTPVFDGERVVVFFPHLGLVALDLDGGMLWTHPMEPSLEPFPVASSPVARDGIIFQQALRAGEGEVLALRAENGELLWRTPWRSAHTSHATPLVIGQRLVVSGSLRAAGLDRSTGDVRWSLSGMAWQGRPMPCDAGDRIVLLSAMPTAGLEGRARQELDWQEVLERYDRDGSGLVEKEEYDAEEIGESFGMFDSDRSGAIDPREWDAYATWTRSESALWGISLDGEPLWKVRRGIPSNTTPLILGDGVVLLRDGGLVTVRELATGELRHDLRVDDLVGDAFASPLLVGNEVVVATSDGSVAVLEPGGAGGFSQRLSFRLEEELFATPAVGAGHLYVRGERTLRAYRLEGTPEARVQAFVDVSVLSPELDRVLTSQTLLVRGGTIIALGPVGDVQVPADADRIALPPGHVLVPGLVDAWAEVEDHGELDQHLLAGITHLRSVDGRPEHLSWRQEIRDGRRPGPRWTIGGAPIGASRIQRRDAEERRYFVSRPVTEGAAAAVERTLLEGYDFATVEFGMHRERWLAALASSKKLGVPLAGPPPSPALASAREAVWSFERAEAFFGPWQRREPIPEPQAPARVARQLARGGAPITPMLSAFDSAEQALARLYEPGDQRDLSPAGRVLWRRITHGARRHLLPEQVDRMAAVSRWQGELALELYRNGAVLLAGSDALAPGVLPGIGLHAELRALHESGIPIPAVLRAATLSGARALGTNAGALEPGRPADLLAVGGDPLQELECLARPAGVMVSGRWFTREELESRVESHRLRYAHEAEWLDTVIDWPATDAEGLERHLSDEEVLEHAPSAETLGRVVEILERVGGPGRDRASRLREVMAR